MHIRDHFKTITRHRREVRRLCFKIGLYRQGLTHDLSKYSPQEFLPGCRYYQGFRSPNDQERQQTGCSRSWMHHKGRNRHHFEYWIDYPSQEQRDYVKNGGTRMGLSDRFQAVEMPLEYVAEMFCDRVAACKVYKGDAYTQKDPLAYQEKMRPHVFMHPETEKLITQMLTVLSMEGEDAACRFIRYLLKKEKRL
ncbi:MAG: catalase [Firmicutes bacterium]|nr:catalase [Bacillota bacterium]